MNSSGRVGVRIKLENTAGRGGTADSRGQEVKSSGGPRGHF